MHRPTCGNTTDLGNLKTVWIDAVGESCNFCSCNTGQVLQVSGFHLIVRLCPDCLRDLKKHDKQPGEET